MARQDNDHGKGAAVIVIGGGGHEADETASLLRHGQESNEQDPDHWEKPEWFVLIELAVFANVFLAGFDGTVTASSYTLISSEFKRADLASWITTSYLLTSTAAQPLYGRFSDIFGRKACLLLATAFFGFGCLGCSFSTNMVLFITMRAITGLGGGGLMTMATIINSDLIPARHRGMYQAIQNILHGVGAISGASLGGFVADTVGWRVCFFAQVPVALTVWAIAGVAVNPRNASHSAKDPVTANLGEGKSKWQQVDLAGATLLFGSLVFQLAGASLGSNGLGWSHPVVLAAMIISTVTLAFFIAVESRCKAIPILPLKMLVGREKLALLLSNLCLGVTAYGFLFLLPLIFQTALLDSASVAGLRMVPPSLATPLGGLTTGIAMRRGANLIIITRVGQMLLLLSSVMLFSLPMHAMEWKYSVYPIPGNFGQGMVYPSILFSFIRASSIEEHAVATSLVYLTRSIGTIWGVSVVSTIVQSLLPSRLITAMDGFPGVEEVIAKLRHSTSAIRDLTPECRIIAQQVYYQFRCTITSYL